MATPLKIRLNTALRAIAPSKFNGNTLQGAIMLKIHQKNNVSTIKHITQQMANTNNFDIKKSNQSYFINP